MIGLPGAKPRRGAGVVAQHASAGYPVAPQSLGAAYPVRPSAHPPVRRPPGLRRHVRRQRPGRKLVTVPSFPQFPQFPQFPPVFPKHHEQG